MLKNLPTTYRSEIVIGFIKLTIRLALILSTLLVLISFILRILCGAVTFESYNLVYGSMPWYSVLIGTWTIIGTIPGLIIVLLCNRRNKTNWPFIKKEMALLGVTTVSVLLFVLIIKN